MTRPREDKSDARDTRAVCIYAKALDITMVKQEGQFKGESFVHKFSRGTIIEGLPRGTIIVFPGGERQKLKKRAVLIRHHRDDKDCWEERDV